MGEIQNTSMNGANHNQGNTLLVFNCHEAWVYQLGWLGFNLDIIVGLKGRYKKTWDTQIRPVPPNSRLITLPEALTCPTEYYCIITHNVTDLLDIKTRTEPKLLVLHLPIEARIIEEKSTVSAEQMIEITRQYVDLVGAHVVAVSPFKGKSWGFTDDIVVFGSDPAEYPPYTGQIPAGLRISNFINLRKQFLLWDFHEKAFADLPVSIVGHNPDIPGIKASDNWAHLKSLLASHRFYIHTADPALEDGYNMATVEAMAAGMPVLGNNHPGSPIVHGTSGFLSDDHAELNRYARMLLQDKQLAIKMGQNARQTAVEKFSAEKFKSSFLRSIETARRKNRQNTTTGT